MGRSKQKNVELAVEIGKAIRRERKAAGMTQAQLAELTSLESETISRLENGVRLPSIEKLVAMSVVFGVPVSIFFVGTEGAPDSRDPRMDARISAAMDKLPDAGKSFVLEVAQNYARYHVTPKSGRKKS